MHASLREAVVRPTASGGPGRVGATRLDSYQRLSMPEVSVPHYGTVNIFRKYFDIMS